MQGLVQEVWSDFQQRHVRVLYVAQGLPGKHGRLVDAVGAASPGDRIEIESGTYHENVVVVKPLEIVAADGASPELTYRGSALTVANGAEVLIEGLSIRQHDRMNEAAAVVVQGADPIFRHCRISSLEVKGSSVPVVQDCTIEGSLKGSGIRLRGHGTGHFVRNAIYSHCGWGIEVESSGTAHFQNNRIWCPAHGTQPSAGSGSNPQRGEGCIRVSGTKAGDACTPLFEDNWIGDSGPQHILGSFPHAEGALPERCAVMIYGSCRPTFTGNHLSGGATGMRVKDWANPVLRLNVFSRFDFYGLWLEGSAGEDTKCRENTLRECHNAGMALGCTARIEVTENEYCRSPGDGICIEKGGHPKVFKNRIENLRIGVRSRAGARGLVTGNVIKDTMGPCVFIEGSTTVKENIIGGTGCREQGIVVCGSGATPVVAKNTLSGLRYRAGIAVVLQSAPVIQENLVELSLEGIAIADGARGKAVGNQVINCTTGMIVQGKRTAPRIENNQIVESGGVGVHFKNRCFGYFSGNTVTGSALSGLLCSERADPYVKNNSIEENGMAGIEVAEAGCGTFVSNRIHSNFRWGISTAGAETDACFRANTITSVADMGATGIQCSEMARGYFEKNIVASSDAGVSISDRGTDPLFVRNKIENCLLGVRAEERAQGRFVRCSISNLKEIGVVVLSGAMLSVENSKISNTVHGVRVDDGSPKVVGNEITSCKTGVWVQGAKSAPAVSDNDIVVNGSYGVLWESAAGTLTGNRLSGSPIGLLLRGAAKPIVEKNHFSSCTDACLKAEAFAEGAVRSCTFESSSVGVLLVGSIGALVIEGNTLKDNTWGVHVHHGHGAEGDRGSSKVTVTGNTISGSAVANVLVEEWGNAVLERNHMHTAPVNVLCRKQGMGTFTGNRLRHCGECCVRVTTGANPSFTRNIIEEAPKGIEVSEKGKGTFDANEMRANATNFHCISAGDPTVINTQLSGCAGPGIILLEGSRGKFMNCIFSGNSGAGIEVRAGASPKIMKCEILGNKGSGILVSEKGVCEVEECRIAKNAIAGIIVCSHARPTVQHNDLSHNVVGILLHPHSAGIFRENTLHSNTETAIRVQQQAAPMLEHNKISQQKMGVQAEQGSRPTFTKNTFHKCDVAIRCLNAERAELKANHFRQNGLGCSIEGGECIIRENNFDANITGMEVKSINHLGCQDNVFEGEVSGQENAKGMPCIGLRVLEGVDARLWKNKFQGLFRGVEIKGQGTKPSLLECKLYKNKECGIRVSDGAEPLLVRCDFRENAVTGLMVLDGGNPRVEECSFPAIALTQKVMERVRAEELDAETWQSGALFLNRSKGEMFRNKFSGCLVGVCVVGPDAEPAITRNEFKENAYGAVLCGNGAYGLFERNFFKGNKLSGMTVRRSANPTVRVNLFALHDEPEQQAGSASSGPFSAFPGPCGLECCSGGAGLFELNTFAHNTTAVRVTGLAQPTFKGCVLAHNTGVALLATDAARGEFTGCVFILNNNDVTISRTGDPTIKDSCFDDPNSVRVCEKGRGSFENCAFTGRLRVSGPGSTPRFYNVRFMGMGVLWEKGAGGVVSECIFAGMYPVSAAALEIRDADTDPTVEGCHFLGCPKAAVLCHAKGAGHFKDVFMLGGRTGLEMRKEACAHIEGSRLEGQRAFGAYIVDDGTKGTLKYNSVLGSEVGIFIGEGAAPRIEQAEVYDSSRFGLHCGERGRAVVRDSVFFDARAAAVFADHLSNLDMVKCDIVSRDDNGALVKDPRADGTRIISNRIRHGARPLPRDRIHPQDRAGLSEHLQHRVKERIAAVVSFGETLGLDADDNVHAASDIWSIWSVAPPPLERVPASNTHRRSSAFNAAGVRAKADAGKRASRADRQSLGPRSSVPRSSVPGRSSMVTAVKTGLPSDTSRSTEADDRRPPRKPRKSALKKKGQRRGSAKRRFSPALLSSPPVSPTVQQIAAYGDPEFKMPPEAPLLLIPPALSGELASPLGIKSKIASVGAQSTGSRAALAAAAVAQSDKLESIQGFRELLLSGHEPDHRNRMALSPRAGDRAAIRSRSGSEIEDTSPTQSETGSLSSDQPGRINTGDSPGDAPPFHQEWLNDTGYLHEIGGGRLLHDDDDARIRRPRRPQKRPGPVSYSRRRSDDAMLSPNDPSQPLSFAGKTWAFTRSPRRERSSFDGIVDGFPSAFSSPRSPYRELTFQESPSEVEAPALPRAAATSSGEEATSKAGRQTAGGGNVEGGRQTVRRSPPVQVQMPKHKRRTTQVTALPLKQGSIIGPKSKKPGAHVTRSPRTSYLTPKQSRAEEDTPRSAVDDPFGPLADILESAPCSPSPDQELLPREPTDAVVPIALQQVSAGGELQRAPVGDALQPEGPFSPHVPMPLTPQQIVSLDALSEVMRGELERISELRDEIEDLTKLEAKESQLRQHINNLDVITAVSQESILKAAAPMNDLLGTVRVGQLSSAGQSAFGSLKRSWSFASNPVTPCLMAEECLNQLSMVAGSSFTDGDDLEAQLQINMHVSRAGVDLRRLNHAAAAAAAAANFEDDKDTAALRKKVLENVCGLRSVLLPQNNRLLTVRRLACRALEQAATPSVSQRACLGRDMRKMRNFAPRFPIKERSAFDNVLKEIELVIEVTPEDLAAVERARSFLAEVGIWVPPAPILSPVCEDEMGASDGRRQSTVTIRQSDGRRRSTGKDLKAVPAALIRAADQAQPADALQPGPPAEAKRGLPWIDQVGVADSLTVPVQDDILYFARGRQSYAQDNNYRLPSLKDPTQKARKWRAPRLRERFIRRDHRVSPRPQTAASPPRLPHMSAEWSLPASAAVEGSATERTSNRLDRPPPQVTAHGFTPRPPSQRTQGRADGAGGMLWTASVHPTQRPSEDPSMQRPPQEPEQADVFRVEELGAVRVHEERVFSKAPSAPWIRSLTGLVQQRASG
eukprot:Hpha_TRINITY_DN15131_c4_g11::TRINITY_DN15131_c4_g11_i1::g.128200::m.128200